MYTRFFGLKQEPFSLAPDPRYLYMSKRHREALAHLLYGVGGGGGFVLLSGEIGAGKTTVCRCFLEQIPKRCNVAYIFNPKLTVLELVRSICDEFRIPYELPRGQVPTVKNFVDPLNEFLLKTHAVGQNNVLIIDEAQMLSVDVLEQLRLLTNLETSERKLLQIVLIGQPELRTMLERPDLEQLAQRVIARFHLKALSPRETEHYVRHRLSVAGMTRSIPFDRKALQRIHDIARGVPRRINLLCDRAMLGAYAHGKQHIDSDIVEKAAREVFGKSEPLEHSRLGAGTGVGLAVATAVALIALLGFAIYGGYRKFVAPDTSVAASAPLAATTAMAASRPASTLPAMHAAATASASASVPPSSVAVAVAHAASVAASTGPAASSTANAIKTVAVSASAASPVAAKSLPPASPAVVTATSPAPLGANELKTALKALGHDEKSAWAELAPLWKLPPGEADACAAAARQQLRCSKFASSLAMVRSLDRPGLMILRDESGKPTTVVLVGLGREQAVLLGANGQKQAVSLTALTKLWQGEFGTIWRLPAGYTTAVAEGTSGPIVELLATQLAAASGEPAPPAKSTMDAALRAKVVRFQSTHGLSPIGKAGPTTFMQLNRASGVDEPRLLADAR